MSKHIKTSLLRPPPSNQVRNFKRHRRRKALKARIKAKREYMAGWVDAKPKPQGAEA
ncbi:MAG: hypothetical protein JWL86_2805 [Rhizobium sp.]|nr:hypothetical protein [Rhizobium sp.]